MTVLDTTVLIARVLPRLYRDSVALMALAAATEKRAGVIRVGAVMATPGNIEILERSDMRPADLAVAPDDLVLVVRAVDVDAAAEALDAAEAGLTAAEVRGGAAVRQVGGVGQSIGGRGEAEVAQDEALRQRLCERTIRPELLLHEVRTGFPVLVRDRHAA